MALTQAAERAALNKVIDYLDEDPEKNIDTIMTLVDKFAPYVPSRREPSTPRSANAITGTDS
ncbi:MAG: hypothetical protein ACLTKG_02970 [Collinsella intestinalis]